MEYKHDIHIQADTKTPLYILLLLYNQIMTISTGQVLLLNKTNKHNNQADKIIQQLLYLSIAHTRSLDSASCTSFYIVQVILTKSISIH